MLNKNANGRTRIILTTKTHIYNMVCQTDHVADVSFTSQN